MGPAIRQCVGLHGNTCLHFAPILLPDKANIRRTWGGTQVSSTLCPRTPRGRTGTALAQAWGQEAGYCSDWGFLLSQVDLKRLNSIQLSPCPAPEEAWRWLLLWSPVALGGTDTHAHCPHGPCALLLASLRHLLKGFRTSGATYLLCWRPWWWCSGLGVRFTGGAGPGNVICLPWPCCHQLQPQALPP